MKFNYSNDSLMEFTKLFENFVINCNNNYVDDIHLDDLLFVSKRIQFRLTNIALVNQLASFDTYEFFQDAIAGLNISDVNITNNNGKRLDCNLNAVLKFDKKDFFFFEKFRMSISELISRLAYDKSLIIENTIQCIFNFSCVPYIAPMLFSKYELPQLEVSFLNLIKSIDKKNFWKLYLVYDFLHEITSDIVTQFPEADKITSVMYLCGDNRMALLKKWNMV
jgi:hypothetical protein